MRSQRSKYFIAVILVALLLSFGLIFYLVLSVYLRPSGPYYPLAEAKLFFNRDESRELAFTPLFCRNHEIAILSSQPFPMKEQFNWKIRVEVYKYGLKIDDHFLKEDARYWYDKSVDSCKSISMGWINVLDWLPGGAMARLTVVEKDSNAIKHQNDFKVVVRASPYN